MNVKLKLTKEQKDLLETFGSKVLDSAGLTYYYLPFYFVHFPDDDSFLVAMPDSLPKHVQAMLKEKREKSPLSPMAASIMEYPQLKIPFNE